MILWNAPADDLSDDPTPDDACDYCGGGGDLYEVSGAGNGAEVYVALVCRDCLTSCAKEMSSVWKKLEEKLK